MVNVKSVLPRGNPHVLGINIYQKDPFYFDYRSSLSAKCMYVYVIRITIFWQNWDPHKNGCGPTILASPPSPIFMYLMCSMK
jgi:hypothetical protein